jgi:hypothetical protein
MAAKTIPYGQAAITPSDTANITTQQRTPVNELAILADSVNVSTHVITKAAHGLGNGDRLIITNHGTTDIDVTKEWYVVSSTTNTFQISSALGGSALTFGGTNTTPPTYQRTSTLGSVIKISGSLFIGGGGDIIVLPESHEDTNDTNPCTGGAVKFTVPSGFYLVGHFKKVFATGTTATNIVCQHD